MTNNATRKNPGPQGLAIRHALLAGFWAILIALPVGFVSQTVLKEVPYLGVSVTILLLVIGVGVAFDVIGVAVTAAREAPLHARAAARVFGARRAVGLVRNAHQVASFCNDVVGDVSGTLSGAIGVSIVFQLLTQTSPLTATLATTFMAGIVAALTVGGKAYGKVFALQRSTNIVFQVGCLLEILERYIPRMRPRSER